MVQVCFKTGKTIFLSRAEASRTRAATRKKLTKNKPRMEVYRCRYCGYYHLGKRTIWKGGRSARGT